MARREPLGNVDSSTAGLARKTRWSVVSHRPWGAFRCRSSSSGAYWPWASEGQKHAGPKRLPAALRAGLETRTEGLCTANHAENGLTERRRSRTYPAWGYQTSPVLKVYPERSNSVRKRGFGPASVQLDAVGSAETGTKPGTKFPLPRYRSMTMSTTGGKDAGS